MIALAFLIPPQPCVGTRVQHHRQCLFLGQRERIELRTQRLILHPHHCCRQRRIAIQHRQHNPYRITRLHIQS